MRSLTTARRAALLGAVFGLAACDIAEFASNPMPRFEQTWNVPAPSTAVSVASLLPDDNSVTILPDSSAFAVTVSGTNITRRVGNDCAQCETLHGTNAFKPAFILNAGNSTGLPADVVAAAVLSGSINVQLTNNMSFDPLFVRTAPASQQGYMLIVVRSGSLVLGRDSVNGATTTFAPGTQMTRNIALTTGTITGNITVDVTIDSPSGDHNEFINANGTLNATATVPTLNVASVSLNVPNQSLDSEPDSIDMGDLDFGEVVSGALEMTISNPFAVTGTLGMRFAYGSLPSEAITEEVTFPTSGSGVATISLNEQEMDLLIGKTVEITVTGNVSSAGPITVTPRQAITIDNRMILVIRTGGEN